MSKAISTKLPATSPKTTRRAPTFIQDIRAKFDDIRRTPLLYRLRPDIGEEARMATVGNYAILFRAMADVVRIERVTYGGRDLPNVIDLS